MRQFILNLIGNTNKPIVYLENFFRFKALLDTGADFPVWVSDESLLKDIGATKIKSDTGNLYVMKYFQLGNLIFPRMHIVTKK